jgi:flagellar basal body-associated protein FliL
MSSTAGAMNGTNSNESSAKQKAALWVAIVFILGAALGGVFGYFYGHRSSVSAANPPLSEPERRAQKVDQLTHELGLSSEQRLQLDSALSELHAQYKSIRDQSDAQMEQARQRGRDQIRSLLTPDQKPKFEEFLKRLDEERKRNAPPPAR